MSVSLIYIFLGLGNGSLASGNNEALYASAAREALRSGHWLTPYFNGQPWFDKPPLAIWITSVFYNSCGINELTSRALSAFCGVGTVLATFVLGRALFNRWVGFIGALILLSTSHFLRFSRLGLPDIPFTFFLSMAFYFFWLAYVKSRYFIYSGFALGIAALLKGPSAFILFFSVVGLYCLLSKRLELLKRSWFWAGIFLAALVSLPWFIYQLVTHHAPFVESFFAGHALSRPQSVLAGRTGNIYFYARALVNRYHPWILIAIVSGPLFVFKAIKDREDEVIFLICWIVVVLGGVVWLKTKLDWYLLPLYPALSLSAAYYFAKIFSEKHIHFVRFLFVAVLALHIPYSHILSNDYSGDIKAMAMLAAKEVPAGQTIHLFNYHEGPAVCFYLDRPFDDLDTEAVFFEKARAKNFYCLIRREHFAPFASKLGRLGIRIKGASHNTLLIAKSSL